MKKRRYKRLEKILKPAKAKNKYIGRLLVATFYNENHEMLEQYFVDNVDICKSHTIIAFDKEHWEVYPFRAIASSTLKGIITVYYENKQSVEIMRIS